MPWARFLIRYPTIHRRDAQVAAQVKFGERMRTAAMKLAKHLCVTHAALWGLLAQEESARAMALRADQDVCGYSDIIAEQLRQREAIGMVIRSVMQAELAKFQSAALSLVDTSCYTLSWPTLSTSMAWAELQSATARLAWLGFNAMPYKRGSPSTVLMIHHALWLAIFPPFERDTILVNCFPRLKEGVLPDLEAFSVDLDAFTKTVWWSTFEAMQLWVALLSGEKAALEVSTTSSVRSVRTLAQTALRRPLLGLARSDSPTEVPLPKDSTLDELQIPENSVLYALVGRLRVKSTRFAFAACQGDGSAVAWGSPFAGGDTSEVADQLAEDDVSANLMAFAAVKIDGSVVTWGHQSCGGQISTELKARLSGNNGVRKIVASHRAFAALKRDGSVVCWGCHFHGAPRSHGLGLSGLGCVPR
eukprot:g13576.t1